MRYYAISGDIWRYLAILPEQLQGRAAGVDLAPAARPRREARLQLTA